MDTPAMKTSTVTDHWCRNHYRAAIHYHSTFTRSPLAVPITFTARTDAGVAPG